MPRLVEHLALGPGVATIFTAASGLNGMERFMLRLKQVQLDDDDRYVIAYPIPSKTEIMSGTVRTLRLYAQRST